MLRKRAENPAKINKIQGFTLLELLIGMALSLVLINGLMAVFAGTVRGSADSLRIAQLSQEMRAVMSVISSEIRRAGYWDAARNNPTAQVGNINPHGVFRVFTAAGTQCVLYSYDDVAGGNHFRGFRIRNGAIEWRRSAAAFNNCNGANAQWSAITTPVVNITAFTPSSVNSQCNNLTTGGNCDPCAGGGWVNNDLLVYVRQIDLILTGNLTIDNQITLTLNDSVRVRNEEIGTAAANYTAAQNPCGGSIRLRMVL